MAELVLKYVTALIWPATVVILLLSFRKALISALPTLLPKSKFKISLFGVEVEITVPELESTTLATLGGQLDERQLALLNRLFKEGPISYSTTGISEDERRWIRPIRNAGLVKTNPTDTYLAKAQSLELTPLGNLLMRSKSRVR